MGWVLRRIFVVIAGTSSSFESKDFPMNSLRPPRSFSLTAAFTLIELLTVIAIIAILMSLLFPVVNSVKESGRKAQAKQDIMGIVTAVKAYNTEYGKYPPMDPAATANAGGADAGVGDPTGAAMPNDNSALRHAAGDRSRCKHWAVKNPRRVVFFEGKSASSPDQPRAGFVDKGSGEKRGSFFDPWGTQYNIVVDTNYDNQVDLNTWYSDLPKDESPARAWLPSLLAVMANLVQKETINRWTNSPTILSAGSSRGFQPRV